MVVVGMRQLGDHADAGCERSRLIPHREMLAQRPVLGILVLDTGVDDTKWPVVPFLGPELARLDIVDVLFIARVDGVRDHTLDDFPQAFVPLRVPPLPLRSIFLQHYG